MKRRGTGKGFVRIAIAIALLVSVVAVLSYVSFITWQTRLADSMSRFALSGNRLPVTLTVFGRGIDTVSARLAFSTADGDVLGTLERSWSGWELWIDCVMVKAGSGWVAFPFLAYTDASAPGTGADLIGLYDRGGFPAIYDSSRLTHSERKAMRRLFALVKTEQWMPTAFGSLEHRTVVLRAFESGAEYALWVAGDGNLKLKAD